ncbi:hypothetical protein IFR05_013063 [Cadophora sp. M221]|nr:hypothetical protein IFR05_013063 [Cadophora sp. M221]
MSESNFAAGPAHDHAVDPGRTFLDTQNPKDANHPDAKLWTGEEDKDGNILFRPPASQFTDQMCLDTNEHFAQPRIAMEAPMGQDMLEIQGYTLDQATTRKWANSLRFLAVKPMKAAGVGEYSQFQLPEIELIHDLWLTEPGEFPGITEYIAVSYCWQKKEQFPKYTVSDARSSTPRPVIAPNEVLDRAIHFAAYHKIRFIWIDQICIDQDNRTDKELGIQSMDLVFQRATFTAGILTTSIDEPRHAEALEALRRARHKDDYGFFPPPGVKLNGEEDLISRAWDIVELYEMLASDRWLTRAWILQEAACAGARLVLLLKCPKGRGWQGDARSLDGIICIDSDHLRGYLVNSLMIEPRSQPLEEFSRRLEASRVKLQNLAPVPGNSEYIASVENHSSVHESSTLIPSRLNSRPVCNMAEALKLLSSRYNSRVPDRLAILANLCDYPLRIDTTKVQQPRFSLSLAVFTMALVNGDLSIFAGVPEEKWASQFRPPAHVAAKIPYLFSWLPPAETILSQIKCYYQNSNSCRMTGHEITKDGLALRGYLWNIDTTLNLREVQKKYGGPYEDIKSIESQQRIRNDRPGIYFDILKTLSKGKEHIIADAIWHIVRSQYLNASYDRYPGLRKEDFPVPASFKDIFDSETDEVIYKKDPLFTGEADIKRLFDMNHLTGYVPQDIIGMAWETLLVGEWITSTILQEGYLTAGSLQTSSGATGELRAIFDVNGPKTILTPHCVNMGGFPRDKILLGHMSWVVQPKKQPSSAWNTLISNGMARGVWNVEGVLSEKFLLS